MARIYDVVCLRCGAVWEWCKYDSPDDECPECHIKTTGYNASLRQEDWDYAKVKVFGCGSTGKEIQALSERIKQNKLEEL